MEALDEYVDVLLNQEPQSDPANHCLKEEKIQVAQQTFKRVLEKPIKHEIKKEETFFRGYEGRKYSNFDFPKKPVQKDTAENSIQEIIKSITDKFNNHKKNESLHAKARIICTHLLAVKERYRNKCFLQISIHLDQYKK